MIASKWNSNKTTARKQTHHKLDARNVLCPLPVIRTQNVVLTLPEGDTLDVSCTDPGALCDIPAWCRINGHEIVEARITDPDTNEVLISIRVGKS
ncbi:MAG: sulfurtransferase TusA family protein [Gammaproteobacteria bacterium]